MPNDRPEDRDGRLRVPKYLEHEPAARTRGWHRRPEKPEGDLPQLQGPAARYALPAAPAHVRVELTGGRRRVLAIAGASLLVTGVIGVVYASRGDDPATASPAVGPPMTLAPIPSEPASAPVSVTTTSPSASPSPTPTKTSPSPKPSPTTTKPVVVTPALALSAGEVPSNVNLTVEGTRDWVHWGQDSASDVDRKTVTPVIVDLGGSSRGKYDNNPELFSWSDGAPTNFTTGTPTGIYSCGEGATFKLRVPASATTRTLALYAGVWRATGQLKITLGGITVNRTLTDEDDISTRRFAIRFKATPGTNLTVTWTATAVFHPTCGNVDMQAATLN